MPNEVEGGGDQLMRRYLLDRTHDVTPRNPGPRFAYPVASLFPAVPGKYGVRERLKLDGYTPSDLKQYH